MLLNVLQLGGASVGVHCTSNKSFVGANQVSRKSFMPAMFVSVTLLMGTALVLANRVEPTNINR